MKTKMVFLDTEFTNLQNPQLISIGLAAESGEGLYLEVPFSYPTTSKFVRDTVIPLLDHSPESFCSHPHLAGRLIEWLDRLRDPDVTVLLAYDHDYDWRLFLSAIANRQQVSMRNTLIWNNLDDLTVKRYYDDTGEAPHHALHDARANRAGYCVEKPPKNIPDTL